MWIRQARIYHCQGVLYSSTGSFLSSVIPAQAGIQTFVSELKSNLDAGPGSCPGQALRGHDRFSLHVLEVSDFNQPSMTTSRLAAKPDGIVVQDITLLSVAKI